ncbi:MAG: hypothetical protein LBD31_01965 [Treponema sp.]|jgi:hypothetical protein|nr:hypothetical protein [Treponema sp.]
MSGAQVVSWLTAVKQSPHLLGHLLGFDKLLPLHSDWITKCWDSPGSHGLMAFRGSYKTSSVVTTGIIRYLLFQPNARILVIRKTHTDACRIVKAVSRAFDKLGIRALFTAVHGRPPKKTADADSHILFSFKASASPEPSLLEPVQNLKIWRLQRQISTLQAPKEPENRAFCGLLTAKATI